ncbi:hypothetical protein LEMLEM_LOCUS6981, partial [Lemmus lemmus]
MLAAPDLISPFSACNAATGKTIFTVCKGSPEHQEASASREHPQVAVPSCRITRKKHAHWPGNTTCRDHRFCILEVKSSK